MLLNLIMYSFILGFFYEEATYNSTGKKKKKKKKTLDILFSIRESKYEWKGSFNLSDKF